MASTITMHSACVPVLVTQLGAMLRWLDKAQAHAEARRFDPNNYLGLRLAPDMLPMSRQVQIATDAAKGVVSRLAGVEVPKWPDDEATLDDLRARIRKALDHVQGFAASQIDGSEDREVLVPMRQGDPLRFRGEAFLKHFALPNFFFHCAMTYALLRHAGVDLGKADFLGA